MQEARNKVIISVGNCKWSVSQNEDENSDMELINTEHHILFHNVHNDTLMVPRAPKSEILINV